MESRSVRTNNHRAMPGFDRNHASIPLTLTLISRVLSHGYAEFPRLPDESNSNSKLPLARNNNTFQPDVIVMNTGNRLSSDLSNLLLDWSVPPGHRLATQDS